MTELPAAAATEPAAAIPTACDVAVVVLTYNNAATVGRVVETARAGLAQHLAGVSAALVATDAGSADTTPDLLAAAGLPAILMRHEAPIPERGAVPFHGVPGRNPALRRAFTGAQALGARVVLVLEADVTSITADWIVQLARPVWDDKADLVLPVHARHRYDGTITNLVLAPLVRALYGRRLRQPFGSALALSGRLVERLLEPRGWNWTGRELADVWIAGTAIAEGFTVWEAGLGARRVESRTRAGDLPDMVAQTLGGLLAVMERHPDAWREVRGSEPVPAAGPAVVLSTEPRAVQVERMVSGFRLGARDLASIWELVLTPETLGDVLALDAGDPARFSFPDDLWARVVYEFALGHHYAVVHRDHLLRSLVPLYLGRTAAFVVATQPRDAAGTAAVLERVSLAFERQKPYLVERWR